MASKKNTTILVLALMLTLTGCINQQDKEVSNNGAELDKKPTEQVITNNQFTSLDGRLTFTFEEGWICREVVYGMRVDCYPEERKSEEYDAGLDQSIVYFPNISIWIEDCVASSIPETDPEVEIAFYFKNYGDCRVRVSVDDEKIDTEEELDQIIME